MHGFKKVLTEWLLKVNPERVFEWGPGLSTEIMLDVCNHDTHIITVEHHDGYRAKAAEKFGNRVELLHLPCTGPDCSYATSVLDRGPVNFAFVDGRRRVECVLAAMQVLVPGGVVLLHDFSRLNYQRLLLPLVDLIEIRDNTAVMRPKAR